MTFSGALNLHSDEFDFRLSGVECDICERDILRICGDLILHIGLLSCRWRINEGHVGWERMICVVGWHRKDGVVVAAGFGSYRGCCVGAKDSREGARGPAAGQAVR
jgi:hypothetical protein